jgi:hypothetical protein
LGGPSPRVEAGLTRFLWIFTVLLLTSVASAQEPRDRASRESQPRESQPRESQPRESQPRVPDAFTPPAGLCRLWIEGVPPSQQPAPTDCASAIRNRPANAAVVFGPQRKSGASDMPSFAGRGQMPIMRQLAPSVRKAARDDTRDRPADTTAKPAPRKPEKPQ